MKTSSLIKSLKNDFLSSENVFTALQGRMEHSEYISKENILVYNETFAFKFSIMTIIAMTTSSVKFRANFRRVPGGLRSFCRLLSDLRGILVGFTGFKMGFIVV